MHSMKRNYNWAKVTLVLGGILGLGWLSTPVTARDMEIRMVDEDTTIVVVAEVQPEFNGNESVDRGKRAVSPGSLREAD